MGSVLLKQLGILIGILVVSATAAAGIRTFTGGCCRSCCQQTAVDAVPAEQIRAAFLWRERMLKYLSVEQIANAAWLLMLSTALVLGAKSFSDSSRNVCHNCPKQGEQVGSLGKYLRQWLPCLQLKDTNAKFIMAFRKAAHG